MASMRYIYTCSFILALLSAHAIPFAEGSRQVKAFKKEKLNSFAGETRLGDQAKKTAGPQGEFQVAPPTPSDDIIPEAKVTYSPTSTSKTPEFGTMLESSPTDFKPTAPGNSPGVGHSVVTSGLQDDHQKPASSHSVHPLSSSPDDFKPTNPGRSPGVGHSVHTMKQEPNA